MEGGRYADGRISIGNCIEERNHMRMCWTEECVAQRKKIPFYLKYNYIRVLEELV